MRGRRVKPSSTTYVCGQKQQVLAIVEPLGAITSKSPPIYIRYQVFFEPKVATRHRLNAVGFESRVSLNELLENRA